MTVLPQRKDFWPIPPIPAVRYLDLTGPRGNPTELMVKTKLFLSWSYNSTKCEMGSSDVSGLNFTDAWLTGPMTNWKNQALQLLLQFFMLKNTLWKPWIGAQEEKGGTYFQYITIPTMWLLDDLQYFLQSSFEAYVSPIFLWSRNHTQICQNTGHIKTLQPQHKPSCFHLPSRAIARKTNHFIWWFRLGCPKHIFDQPWIGAYEASL